MRLLAFYGDDFTGSTDVMEALASHGVETVLFTRIPTAEEFAGFAGYPAIGIAGTSRSETPEWMDRHLPEVFAWAKTLDARFVHYKVCSTFDSAPKLGNIGRAVEIGRRVFAQGLVPLVVGAPQLKRYTAFGQLFAAYQGEVYRIDRHPVMSRHPVTPMAEADLRLHLAQQTKLPVALVPFTAIQSNATLEGHDGLVLLDVLDQPSQSAAGRKLLRLSEGKSLFVAGSSGVEYALLPELAAEGAIPGTADFRPLGPVDRLMAVSGSCSPTTARQIRHALANGFAGIAADPVRLATAPAHAATVAADAIALLQQGRSVIVYTALDGDGRGDELDALPGGRHAVGQALGAILGRAVKAAGLSRAVIAGGDTSSHALGRLDIFALTTRYPLKATPGSPLCIGHSRDTAFDGIEIAMKGGQIGGDDYFVMLRDGLAAPLPSAR